MNPIPRRLYKYLHPDRVDALRERLVRYTQLGDLNDPFEAKPYISGLTSKREADEIFERLLPQQTARAYDALPPKMRALVPEEAWTALVNARFKDVRADLHAFMESFAPSLKQVMTRKFDELVGVLSLSEVPDNLLMWAHYTGRHTGFVLGFEPQDPYFDRRRTSTDEFRHLRRVVYSDSRPQAFMADLDAINFFLTKSAHWAYEHEWRVLEALIGAKRVIDENPYPIHLFEYPASALSEVILGAKVHAATKAAVTECLRQPEFKHVDLRQATLDDCQYAVRLTEIAV
jgi:hypothetical protein